MTHAQAFLKEIDTFLAVRAMKPSTFGKAAVGDANFVGDLRNGRQPSLGMVDRVHAFMRQCGESETA